MGGNPELATVGQEIQQFIQESRLEFRVEMQFWFVYTIQSVLIRSRRSIKVEKEIKDLFFAC